MRRIKKDIWYYRGYDIFYSPDEGGYYPAQGNAGSKIYKTRVAVRKAIDTGKIINFKEEFPNGN